MTIKDKITKIIIYFTGLAALYLYVLLSLSGKTDYLLDKDILKATNNFEYGDLYLLNLIDNFKVPTPPLDDEYYKSVPKSDINEVDILTFGDSFFAEGARVKNVPARLADTLKKKVFFGRSDNILNFLEEQNYQKKDRKYLILEIVERGIPGTFTDYQNILTKKNNIISNIIETVMPINLEQRYTFLFQKGFLTHYIYKELATLKFSIFGYITSITPVYKKDPPWLFYYMDVNDKKTSFYYKFSDDEIKTICDNISDLSIQLKNSYNLDLILLPVPNKYTIYHKLLNNDEYNNFLPRIYSELKKGNVKVCEVYDLFMKSDKELYYPTDTHWNDEGVKIAVTELLKMIN